MRSRGLQRERETERTIDRELDLLRLGIGFGIAENEKEQLNDYFVETTSYKHAFERDKAIFTGRKGAGKTALFYKMQHD